VDYPLVWVVMGVSGSGKTTAGRLLSERLEGDFLEGDRRHPSANVRKMRDRVPLQDADRAQWLDNLERDIRSAIARGYETVLTCSALKIAYRQRLAQPGRVQLVWLQVSATELRRRLSQREDHYMRVELLQSQLDACEAIAPHEGAIVANGEGTPAAIVGEIWQAASAQFPTLNASWWERTVR